MTKKFILIFVLLLSVTIGYAQSVTWNFSSNKLKSGEVELVFSATIPAGYHLYSPYNPAGASLPLTISLNESSDFQQVGKIIETSKPTEAYSDIFEVTEKYFTQKAEFKIKIKPVSSSFTVTGKLKGQACTDVGACVMVRKDFSISVGKSK